jgi:hypothetical protein
MSDSLQFAYRTVMATVTLGLLHNEQGHCMQNTEGSRLALVWILQTEQPDYCFCQLHA